jgi:solute carrier family 25 citrate transporter 1
MPKQGEVTPFVSAVIGGLTGAAEISITYPTEYIKTCMQLYPDINKKGAMNFAKESFRTKGYLSMYKGYSALLFFSVPKNYTRFGAFQYVKDHVFTAPGKLNTFMCGLAAGAAEAAIVVTPMETLKVKLIHDKLSPEPKYRNLFHGIYKIGQQYGIGGIYSGLLPTILKQSSNQGTRFLVFGEI